MRTANFRCLRVWVKSGIIPCNLVRSLYGGDALGTQPSSAALAHFANFEFDLRTGELRRDGTSLKLQPQPARVLTLLVSQPGKVITRQELAEQVWGTETFVDFEQGLNFAIRQIRTALEDDADHPRFLETLPKRGYRFIAEVEGPPKAAVVAAESKAESPPPGEENRPGKNPRSSTTLWAVAGAGVLLLTVLAIRRLGPGSDPKGTPGPIQSVAVLPLVALSADPVQEYFSDGLTDELITELAKIGDLRVISRTSVTGYKGTHRRVPEIGQELHVDAIVEGTVERVGDRVRIRAQLIHAATDQHLWAESYDRDLSDVLRLEGDVARDIAQQIGHRRSEQRTQLPDNRAVPVGAHEDYLKGRYYWNKRTKAGLQKGIEYFQKAIEQDPNYALAYAGLADSDIMLANWGFRSPGEAYPNAKAAARKALELDPQLVEAQTSLAYITLLYDWDWEGAERGFRQAIALNPNYASAHHFYSICLMTSGRQAEALAEIRRAQELDPLSLIINSVHGWIYYEGRQYDQAILQYTKTLEMDPSYVPALQDLGTSYVRMGAYRKAIAQFEKAIASAGDNGVVLSDLAQAHALAGDPAEAQKILQKLQKPAATFVSPWDLSLIYVALGNKRRAIGLLQKAADEHVGWVVLLGVDPALDPLRAEPQFKELMRRVRVRG
jgi:TolB-like protein/DNA-binding winged helix-turn-helix (wHTH) protein/Tfp pilus assembly protein PilF